VCLHTALVLMSRLLPACLVYCQVERHTGQQYFKRMSLKECLRVSVDRCAIFFRKVGSVLEQLPAASGFLHNPRHVLVLGGCIGSTQCTSILCMAVQDVPPFLVVASGSHSRYTAPDE
jgi:hypothetical protein